MKKNLTISVAAYNVEAFLDPLMQSIIDSGVLDQIEILIVDDGSKDGTAEKAGIYQTQHPDSVRLIRKENGGHGSAINRGIQEATGKYFRTLDGDDWLHPMHLQKLVEKLDNLDVDIILSNYCECYPDGERVVIDDYSALERGRVYSLEELLESVEWMRHCTVIYRTGLLQEHNIQLDEKCFYVDPEYALFPIPYVNTIYYAKDYLYCYRLGRAEQSASDISRMRLIADSEKVSKSLLNSYKNIKARLSDSQRRYYVEGVAAHCLFHFKSIMLFPADKKNKRMLIAFEKTVKNAAPEVFIKMAHLGRRSRMLRFLRATRYTGYGIMCRYKHRETHAR